MLKQINFIEKTTKSTKIATIETVQYINLKPPFKCVNKKDNELPKKSSATKIFLEMERLPPTHIHQKELLQIAYISFWRLEIT